MLGTCTSYAMLKHFSAYEIRTLYHFLNTLYDLCELTWRVQKGGGYMGTFKFIIYKYIVHEEFLDTKSNMSRHCHPPQEKTP